MGRRKVINTKAGALEKKIIAIPSSGSGSQLQQLGFLLAIPSLGFELLLEQLPDRHLQPQVIILGRTPSSYNSDCVFFFRNHQDALRLRRKSLMLCSQEGTKGLGEADDQGQEKWRRSSNFDSSSPSLDLALL